MAGLWIAIVQYSYGFTNDWHRFYTSSRFGEEKIYNLSFNKIECLLFARSLEMGLLVVWSSPFKTVKILLNTYLDIYNCR